MVSLITAERVVSGLGVEGIVLRSGIWNACARERKRDVRGILGRLDAVASSEASRWGRSRDGKEEERSLQEYFTIAALRNLPAPSLLARSGFCRLPTTCLNLRKMAWDAVAYFTISALVCHWERDCLQHSSQYEVFHNQLLYMSLWNGAKRSYTTAQAAQTCVTDFVFCFVRLESLPALTNVRFTNALV